MKTAVAFIIFNRPDTTARVFAEIRKARPPRLMVIADGPRAGRPGEKELCDAARAVVEKVDWDCEVLKDYGDVNLGCRRRVSSGLDWVFDTVEECIILEDDCLPHPSFFKFCEELLDRYRDDERVSMISGNNFLAGVKTSPYSYYFSRIPHIWGWASWRRHWKNHDPEMRIWPEIRDGDRLEAVFADAGARKFWEGVLESTYQGKINSWGYPLLLTTWTQSALCAMPMVNLVTNIGFGPGGTHTVSSGSKLANIPAGEMEFPLFHPPYIMRDSRADYITERDYLLPHPRSLTRKAGAAVKRSLARVFRRVEGHGGREL